MEYTVIQVTRKGGVGLITLSSPENRNALTEQLMVEVRDALAEFGRDTGIRCVILTGSGKAFMAGANLKAVGQLSVEENAAYNSRILAMTREAANLRVPVIAAINGYAFGGGLELALACTLRIASEKALMGLPEVGLGILPGAGGAQRLPRLIPMGRAMKLMLTGETVTAQEALEAGIIEEVTPPEELLPRAFALAEQIAGRAPLAVEAIKDCVLAGADLPLEEAMAYTCKSLKGLTDTEDFREGIASFLEKRPPVFRRK